MEFLRTEGGEILRCLFVEPEEIALVSLAAYVLELEFDEVGEALGALCLDRERNDQQLGESDSSEEYGSGDGGPHEDGGS